MGTFQLAPTEIVAAEGQLTLAGPPRDYRQARFTQRFLARLQGHSGLEEVMEQQTGLAELLRKITGLGPGEEVEKQFSEG